jgi:hypothetical protein
MSTDNLCIWGCDAVSSGWILTFQRTAVPFKSCKILTQRHSIISHNDDSNLMSDSISTIFPMLKKIKCDSNAYSLFLELWVPTFNSEWYYNSPLPFLKAIFLCIHGDWHPHIMKTFIILSLHTKLIMHQQNTMNQEDNIIRKKYILKNMTVMWSFHHITVKVAGLLACCIM